MRRTASSCVWAPTARLQMDAGVKLAPLSIAYQTYGALNGAKSNAILVCHALTGDQHVANRQSGDRQGRLVGDHGRPGQADRYRPFLRHLRQCGRRLHGHDRPASTNPATGARLWPRFAAGHHRRHGARPGHADGSSRHRHAVLRRRRLDGRHAGAAMGGGLSRARLSAALPHRHARQAFGSQNIAFHEVGRQAIMADPDWRDGRYLAEGRQPRQGPGRRAHGRAHHLPLGAALQRKFGRKLQDRAEPDLFLRRRFPDRELSAPSGVESSSSGSTPIPIST